LASVAAQANPFAATGMWLRCALHAHTTRSDGELSPEELVNHYERAGFDVLAITDHWVRTEAQSTDRLLVIPSSELSCVLPEEADGHLLAFGIDEDPFEFMRTRPDLAGAAAWVGEHGGVAYLAHPYWTGTPSSGLSLGDGVAGIEVYNAGCELEVGRGLSTVHWDELLARGSGCFGIAADDSHHAERDSGLAWVWTRVAERSAAAVLDALASGSFYSSTGPVLQKLRIEEGSIEVECSPSGRVTLCTGRKRGTSVSSGPFGLRYGGEILAESDDGEITRARLERPPRTPYGRLELVDPYGRKAWTNPLWC
jgi:predicted metal-dependent phosphoesterase TrpH